MINLKLTNGRLITFDADMRMTTPQQILNFFVERSRLGVDDFRIIMKGQLVAGADLDKTCSELGWHMIAVIHLVLTPAAQAFIAELPGPFQLEAAYAGCGAGCGSRA